MSALQVLALVLVAAGAAAVTLTREPGRQVVMLSIYGVLLAVLFFVVQAPDVALSQLTVGAVVLPLILLIVLAKVRRREGVRPGQRKLVFLAALAGLLALYLWGLVGLPGFGHYPGPYGDVLNAVVVAQRHATDVVTAINFDYRGFDTVGEEFILFTAATGVSVVLRQARRERERPAVDEARDRNAPQTSDAVRLACLLFIGPTALVGWEVVTHGQISPGGGFQGGVVLATAFLLVYLGGQYLSLRRISPVDVTDAVEAIGAGGFVVIGLSALFVGLPYLANDLPLGMSAGTVDSSGTIALISFFVGLEVTAAFVLIAGELLEQTLIIRTET